MQAIIGNTREESGTIKEKIVDIEGSGRVDFYCAHNPYPYGAPNFPTPHFDLEFWVRLPR